MKSFIKNIIIGSRWLLVPLYLGMTFSMVVFVIKFFQELAHLVRGAFLLDEAEILLHVLSLIDIVLVANLVIMVIISGYETFVSPLKLKGKDNEERPGWLSTLDPGTVKIKLASSVVGISLIHILTMYLKIDNFTTEKILWSTIIHIVFLITALFLAFVDRLTDVHHGD